MAGKDDPVRTEGYAGPAATARAVWPPILTPHRRRPFLPLSFPTPSQAAWAEVRIPSVLVSASQGQRLIRLMRTEEVDVEGHGPQRYTP